MPEAAYKEAYVPGAFVTKDAFDIHVRSMRDRADSEEKLSDARFDRIEALIAGSLAEQRAIARETGSSIKAINERISHVEKNMDKLNEKFEKMQGDISELKGNEKALTARLDTQQTKFGWYLTLFGLIITVVVATIQLLKQPPTP